MMKWIVMVGMLIGVACANADQAQWAHITQDSLSLEMGSGKISFHDNHDVSADELSALLNESYSIELNVWLDTGNESDGLDDLFGEPKKEDTPKTPVFFKPAALRKLLDKMDAAGIPPELVILNLYVEPTVKRDFYHKIEVGKDEGLIEEVKRLQALNTKEAPYYICSEGGPETFDYRLFKQVLETIGDDAKVAGFRLVSDESVEVEALILEINDDGSEDVVSAPKVTTKAGNEAIIRVVENASGFKHRQLQRDKYHQKDLANLGICFAVTPQIIGDYLKVEGVVILTKLDNRQAVFVDQNIPVASYLCTKLVVPVSVVFPEGTDTVEFDIASMDGKNAKCRLTAQRVDNKGMTRKHRQAARQAATTIH